MQIYEVSAILEKLQYKNRDAWEQTRMIMYVIAQSNSKKKLSPSNLMTFPWEKEKQDSDSSHEMTKEDAEELRKKMQEFIKSKSVCQQI